MAASVTIDASGLVEKITELGGEELALAADAVVDFARDNVQSRLHRQTGTLEFGIVSDTPRQSGREWVTEVRSQADYSSYQDEGTGIYGPTGQRIIPVSSKALVFYWPSGPRGADVYAFASVAGSPATHFWTDALDQWDNIVRAL